MNLRPCKNQNLKLHDSRRAKVTLGLSGGMWRFLYCIQYEWKLSVQVLMPIQRTGSFPSLAARAQVAGSSDIPEVTVCQCYTHLSFPVPGHPLTKAFITHGGTNGIYEAIYHGIPLVGIPMFADQHDNIAHMRAKGAAVELDFSTLKTEDLVDAVNTVINNSS